jgi:uncharacterized protein (TIGR03086 family)
MEEVCAMTTQDPLQLYEAASNWTIGQIRGSVDMLDSETPCDSWDLRTLLNHMLETQRFFTGAARGEKTTPPSPTPTDLIDGDPIEQFEHGLLDMVDAYSETTPDPRSTSMLGIAFADQLIHGWDIARATGQDDTMPDGLAEAALEILSGRLTDDQRKGAFKPAIVLDQSASAQEQLLAFSGRDPR